MSQLAKYNPLGALALPNVGTIPTPRGLIVIAGPNSSGKTQLLLDIEKRVIGVPRELVVAQGIDVTKPESYSTFEQDLISEGLIRTDIDDKGRPLLRQWLPHFGAGSGGWSVQKQRLESFYQQFSSTGSVDDPGRLQFLKHVGPLFTTSLFLNRRLQLTSTCAGFDYEANPPQSELQALFMSQTSQRELSAELARTFGNAVWLDATRGNKLCLRVKDSPELPSAEERLQPEEMKKYRTIESEGDGLNSYAGICISLLLGRRPVCLIDEPEMCLHPPQAYALGRFIGRYGTPKDHTTFVATHSSHVLRGIVDETDEVQVIRLFRTSSAFVANVIQYDDLRACIERPSTKAETVLDGVFAEAVTVVESEGDRLVYSAAAETIRNEIENEIHFVSVGGIGGISNTCKLYESLRIPVVAIADLDLILKPDELNKVLLSLTNDTEANEIGAAFKAVSDEIDKIHPKLTKEELTKQLREIVDGELDWSNRDDVEVRRKLSRLSSDLSRSAILKRGGVANLNEHPTLKTNLEAAIKKSSRVGLHLVPVGELEFWLAERMKDVSKKNKAEWANKAAICIREAGSPKNDVWGFVRNVAEYQRDEASKLAGYS